MKIYQKLANKIAKKYCEKGVYKIILSDQLNQILSDCKVEDIWGISKGWGARLKKIGIYNPIDYKKEPARYCGTNITDNPYYDI